MRLSTRQLRWAAFYTILVVVVLALVLAAILPAYRSPYSRLYSSSIGLPALLRALDRHIPIEVSVARYRTMERVLSATGAMRHFHRIPIGIETPGVVVAVHATLGSEVAAHQILASIDTGGHQSRIVSLDLELKRRQLRTAERDYQREWDAHRQGLISSIELGRYKSQLDEAAIAADKAEQLWLQATLSRSLQVAGQRDALVDPSATSTAAHGYRLEVIAPVAGRIIEKNVSAGQNLVSPVASALVLGTELMFRAQFDQRYVGQIQQGEVVELYLRAHPERRLRAKVEQIESSIRVADSSTLGNPPLVFNVWLRLDLERALAPLVSSGMNGYAVVRRSDQYLAIPESALIRYSGRQGLVLVAEPNSDGTEVSAELKARRIDYDLAADGWVAIRTGLHPGDVVVKSGQIALREHDKVSYRAEAPALSKALAFDTLR